MINAVIKDTLSINAEAKVHSMIYNDIEPTFSHFLFYEYRNLTVVWLEFYIPSV